MAAPQGTLGVQKCPVVLRLFFSGSVSGFYLEAKLLFFTNFLLSKRPYLVRSLLRRFGMSKIMIFLPSATSKIMPPPQ